MQIYLITNLVNGKRYVGQTTQPLEKRFKRHCSGQDDMCIARAIQKYGKENFSMETVYYGIDSQDLNEKEEFYIEEFKTLVPNGYNVRHGGGNSKMNEETKIKISKANKGIRKTRDHAKKVKKRMLEIDPDYYWKLGKMKKNNPYSSSKRQNLSNGKKSKSGLFVGVCPNPDSYRAEFYFKGVKTSLSFKSEIAAAHYYDFLCIQHGFDPINFPADVWDLSRLESERSLPKSRTSVFYGVKEMKSKSWNAIIWFSGKSVYIGTFKTEIEAGKAVDSFLIKNGKPPRNFT